MDSEEIIKMDSEDKISAQEVQENVEKSKEEAKQESTQPAAVPATKRFMPSNRLFGRLVGKTLQSAARPKTEKEIKRDEIGM